MDTRTQELNGPLVSVTMVTHNRGAYICEAIASVLAQTYANWELIIVDDGSTDDTESIVRSFTDPRIRYLRHAENQGVHAVRTEALAAANGAYIAVLDSDDLWQDPRKLETQVAFLEKNPGHAIVGTFIHTIDADGTLLRKGTYHTDDRSIRRSILLRNQFAHSSVLMRADRVRAAGGYQEVPLGEDLDLFLRLGLHGKFANLPISMTSYRVHNAGLSRNGAVMAHSVLGFVRKYRAFYPHALQAYAKSALVMLLARVRDTRRLR